MSLGWFMLISARRPMMMIAGAGSTGNGARTWWIAIEGLKMIRDSSKLGSADPGNMTKPQIFSNLRFI